MRIVAKKHVVEFIFHAIIEVFRAYRMNGVKPRRAAIVVHDIRPPKGIVIEE
ncbi:hypothetical protein [Pectinatus frisingensis]|uniref:hypothetical protein n=1 Tax=Pectinatus frisingensis TaxID=865 RepID=UPI001E4588F9|nr:hypothetical protein [Pectinatus frisingensis]